MDVSTDSIDVIELKGSSQGIPCTTSPVVAAAAFTPGGLRRPTGPRRRGGLVASTEVGEPFLDGG